MKKLLPLFLVLVGGASAFACGSDGSSNSGASCAPASYQSQATPACTSCVESSCSSQYQTLCNAHCNSGSAGSGQLSSDCTDAVIAVGECANEKCPVCVPAGSGGSGSGTGGSSSSAGTTSSSDGSSASGTGKACTIGGVICNYYANLPASSVQQACADGSGTLSDHCSSTGLSGCCTMPSATVCYYGTDASSLQSACTQAGGTWGTTPP